MNATSLEAELRTENDALAALVVNSDLMALALVEQERFLFVNRAFSRMFGRTTDLVRVQVVELFLPEDREQVYAALRSRDVLVPACVTKGRRGDSSTFEVELHFDRVMCDGQSLLAISAQDVTDRHRTQAQLSLLAYSDPLTGVANRALFADRLRQAALGTRRTGQGFAVVMLDLDRFKPINDSHGHEAGDRVLQRISSRFTACLRDTDTVARLGGDEFAVLLPALKVYGDAGIVAGRLVEAARQHIDLGTISVEVNASAGIAIYPEHAVTVDQLLAAADAALYAAKRGGGGCVTWASAVPAADAAPAPLVWNVAHEIGVREIDEQHANLAALLNQLAGALRNGEEHAALFREIVRYTGFHFACEERLMRTCHYDGAAAHREMHRRLLADLRGLRLEEAEAVSVSLTLRYLQEWLLHHVDGADRDLAAVLRAAGTEQNTGGG